MIKTVTAELLDRLTAEAKASERKRAFYTLHTDMNDPVHRFLVVAEPETVVNFHRHPGKWELTVVLRGEIEVITCDETGRELGRYTLTPGGACSALEMPDTVFHRFVAKTSSAFLEVKQGPYTKPEELVR